jgi:hypothetical protein
MKSNEKVNTSQNPFVEGLHRSGRLFTIVVVAMICLVPVVYCLSARVMPDWNALAGAIMFILSYWAIGLIEAVSYAPVLGVGGQYQAFITGNISNLKLPCSINAQSILKTQKGTEEQEIISTIAISVSSIVTTVIILIGIIPLAIFGGDIVNALQPVSPYVIPAIFGGLGLVLLSMYFKLTIIPFAVMLVVMLALFLFGVDLGQSTSLTIGMAVSVISGIIVYRVQKKKGAFTVEKNKKDKAKETEAEQADANGEQK